MAREAEERKRREEEAKFMAEQQRLRDDAQREQEEKEAQERARAEQEENERQQKQVGHLERELYFIDVGVKFQVRRHGRTKDYELDINKWRTRCPHPMVSHDLPLVLIQS